MIYSITDLQSDYALDGPIELNHIGSIDLKCKRYNTLDNVDIPIFIKAVQQAFAVRPIDENNTLYMEYVDPIESFYRRYAPNDRREDYSNRLYSFTQEVIDTMCSRFGVREIDKDRCNSFNDYIVSGGISRNLFKLKGEEGDIYLYVTRGYIVDVTNKKVLLCLTLNRDRLYDFHQFHLDNPNDSSAYNLYVHDELIYEKKYSELFLALHYGYFKSLDSVGIKPERKGFDIPSSIFQNTEVNSFDYKSISELNGFFSRMGTFMAYSLDYVHNINQGFVDEFIVEKGLDIIDDVVEFEIIDDLEEEVV